MPLKEVQIGQEVLIAELNQLATVTARPDRNGMVEVRAGIMKNEGASLRSVRPGQNGQAPGPRAAPFQHPRAAG